MRTRTSDNWKCKPGYFDVHHVSNLYESSNIFGIPDLLEENVEAPSNGLVPYNIRIRSEKGYKGLGIHFFIDDYRFESVWVRPSASLQRLSEAESVLTPDFSVYANFPRVVQIYNIYKSRWLGRYWQDNGIKVIPTVSWSDKESYSFCFSGIPKTMPVAISTVGITKENTTLFLDGYFAMLEKINPAYIICYGKPTPYMEVGIPIKAYKSGLKAIRALRENGIENIIEKQENQFAA